MPGALCDGGTELHTQCLCQKSVYLTAIKITEMVSF